MAGYTVSIETKGFKEFASKLANSPIALAEVKMKMINRMVDITREKAVMAAPSNTGNLRQNIKNQSRVVTTAGDFTGIVEANIKSNGYSYGVAQEYGTGIYAGKGYIYPKRAKILAWKKGGMWIFAKKVRGVPARKYMFQAVNTLKSRMGEVMSLGQSIVTKLSF